MFNSDQKRAFLAVILSGAILFGWQLYFGPKQKAAAEKVEAKAVTADAKAPVSPSTLAANTTSAAPTDVAKDPINLSNVILKNGEYSFQMNNDLSFENATNPNSVFPFSDLAGVTNPLKVELITDYGALDVRYDIVKVSDSKVTGSNANFGIQFEAELKEDGKMYINFASQKPYKYRFLFEGKEKKLDNGQIRHFIYYNNSKVNIVPVGDDKESDGSIKWIGMDFNYHLFTFVFNGTETARYKITEDGKFYVDTNDKKTSLSGHFVFTKKTYDHLVTLGDNLHLSVDFGMLSVLAVPMLHTLQWFYKYIPNYGIAIIILTILIRLITFPLQWKSFKSMKKMQKIQPDLQKIREKYKDEPQKLQSETMELFKRAGANPLSGCLPLLLQMPFFFAIYKVLYSAVELVDAPFVAWIVDLSVKDPYYVLPVLMTISMFLQQKLTPQSTMDPTQQKVMLLMPIIFGFIMHSLPAGLVLYIFVSTIFGLLQQLFVYKFAED